MKNYIKPCLEYVELRTEERFAEGSPCSANGNCGTATFTYTPDGSNTPITIQCNKGY